MHSLLVQLCTPRQARSKASSTHARPQRALRYPGALVRHRLQTSPIARACCSPQHRSEAMLCSPLTFFFPGFFFFLLSFPGVFLLWITLIGEAGSSCSPPSSSTVLRLADAVGVAAPKSLLLQHALLAKQGGRCGSFQNL